MSEPPGPVARPLRIWAVSDGRVGIENQALGVAEAIARRRPAEITIKRLLWRPWLRRLPTRLVPWPRAVLDPASDDLTPPWPDLWIGNGRAAIPASIAMRRWSKGRTLVVQLQDPLRDPALFDVVSPPAHDRLSGPNVFPLLGAPHRITAERLAQGLMDFPDFEALPHPRIGVLIGGKSKAFDLPVERAGEIADQLLALVQESGGSLLMTFSRRTPDAARAALSKRLAHLPGMIWPRAIRDGAVRDSASREGALDDAGPNPYTAILAAADHILVTADSINMVAEAASTGKPVQILALPGGQARKNRFHADLADRDLARPFEGRLETWPYEPLRETDRLADHLMSLLGSKA